MSSVKTNPPVLSTDLTVTNRPRLYRVIQKIKTALKRSIDREQVKIIHQYAMRVNGVHHILIDHTPLVHAVLRHRA
jgi:hypothetical protein